MELVLGLLIGIGLSAACGFRVFVPFLGLSIASLAGDVTLAPGFEWIGTWPALLAFATATALEIAAYYIPWVDNLLDTAATPAAVVAGTLVMASQISEMSPLLKWSLAIIAGGGVAALVQTGTVTLRAASTATTAGVGNFLVATLEWVAALVMTALAIVVPVVCFLAVLWLVCVMVRKLWLRPRLVKPPAG